MEDITARLHADKNKPVERGKLIVQESAKSLSMQKREWDSKQHKQWVGHRWKPDILSLLTLRKAGDMGYRYR